MKNKNEVNLMSPLTWAYIGDSVYELFIREHLVNTTNLKPNKLHKQAISYVKAKAQSEILNRIHDELTEKEQEIVRRTRNTQNHHLPKNAELADYMYATAFEGLIGYLYLAGEKERLDEILNKCINA
ncbi:MAG: Mini-ribonuclease 3 [Clostridiales bacterium]|nr:Mini-ribonuclease 3 [Clostridiales bacterium]